MLGNVSKLLCSKGDLYLGEITEQMNVMSAFQVSLQSLIDVNIFMKYIVNVSVYHICGAWVIASAHLQYWNFKDKHQNRKITWQMLLLDFYWRRGPSYVREMIWLGLWKNKSEKSQYWSFFLSNLELKSVSGVSVQVSFSLNRSTLSTWGKCSSKDKTP